MQHFTERFLTYYYEIYNVNTRSKTWNLDVTDIIWISNSLFKKRSKPYVVVKNWEEHIQVRCFLTTVSFILFYGFFMVEIGSQMSWMPILWKMVNEVNLQHDLFIRKYGGFFLWPLWRRCTVSHAPQTESFSDILPIKTKYIRKKIKYYNFEKCY